MKRCPQIAMSSTPSLICNMSVIFGRPGIEVLVPAHKDTRPSESKDSGFLDCTKTYQKISISGLPKIGLNDRPNILHISVGALQLGGRLVLEDPGSVC